jgi:hypothetical protein
MKPEEFIKELEIINSLELNQETIALAETYIEGYFANKTIESIGVLMVSGIFIFFILNLVSDAIKRR